MNKLLIVLVLLLVAAPAAWAAVFNVNSTTDAVDALPGDGVCATAGAVCTLRAAIQESNALAGVDTINLPAGTYTIAISGDDDNNVIGDLDIQEDLTLIGAGSSGTVVNGGGLDRVFDLRSNASATMSGLTIQNGDIGGGKGGGIRNDNSGSLTLTDVILTGNLSTNEGGAIYCEGNNTSLTLTNVTIHTNQANHGAGIFLKNDNTLSSALTDITIRDNTSTGEGGGMRVESSDGGLTLTGVTLSGNSANKGGGIFFKSSSGPALTNVTISGNSATSDGGGIRIESESVSLLNVTLTANTAPAGKGGGIDRSGGTITLKNTIVANSISGGDCSGTITSAGNNLDTDGTCGFTLTSNPLLGPLQDNDGPTFTHALLAGSPAIDAVLAGCPPPGTDQRGVIRPQGASCDIGAFEHEPKADLTLTKTDNPDPAPVDGPLVYTLVVTNNGPDTATAVVVTDDLPDSVSLEVATPSQGSCAGTDPVVCSLGAIVATGTASVEILVTTSSTGTINNDAGVTADPVDPVPADNSASEDTEVVADTAISDVPLTQYRRIHGFVDYTVTGGSLRTQPNPGGGACVVGASSTESLAGIPGTATVAAAYLYWAASGSTIDDQVTFDGTAVTADRTFQSRFSLGANDYDFFGGFEDVTAQVAAKGNGSYTFEDLTIDTGSPWCSSKAVLGGWSLIVVYEDTALSGKTLVLYDGFDLERNGAVSYLLTGIYSADPPEAKTTLLVWEGDDDLGGAGESLEFNGAVQSDALNPADNVYNSTINSLGVTDSYGLDLDTFDVSGEVSAGDTLATTRVSVGPDLVILNGVVLQAKSNIITGRVFEDVNYGGGSGRNLATAAAAAPSFTVARPGAVVELYDAGGAFLRTTAAGPTGEYGFTGLVDGDYQVRVVNETVDSSRPGATLSEWPVQTFRTNASSGTALPVVGEVGGASPAGQDSGPNVAMINLGTIAAQSVSPVKITTGIAVSGVDFGYNFDTVVNTNDAGQGSLRQFILNSNNLTNANLAQDGLAAGTEHSLFMIPSDFDPYGRAQDPGFDAARGVAVITPDSLLPAIIDADTAIDGTTQTVGVEDSNTASLGAGGTVGVDGLALPTLAGPEIELADDVGLAVGIDVQADDVKVRGLAIYGFGTGSLNNGNVRVGLDDTTNFTGVTVEDNVLGGFADSFTDPDLVLAGSRTLGVGFAALGADFGTLRRSLIGFTGRNAALLSKAANDWTVENNEFRDAGQDDARSDGLGLTDDVERTSVTGNLFADNQGAGVDFFASVGSHTLLNNTFDGNGQGGAETAGVRMFGADGVVDRNVFNNQTGSGVLAIVFDPAFPTANTPATHQRITRNHFGGNGANAIDLQTTLDIVAPGDGITLNDGTLLGDSSVPNACGTVATHGNEGLDTPIVDLALLGGGGATVRGRACPGAEVEIYRAVADGDASDTLSGTDYGEGVTYLATAIAAAGTGLFEATGVAGLSAGDAVSAIAIDSNDNTSEFSGNGVVQALSIVKRAFQSDGTPIASGSALPAGMPVKFMLYISNPGGPVTDVSMRDALNPLFLYVSGSTKYDNSVANCAAAVCTAGEEAAIFAAADSGSVGTDAVDGDVVSFVGVTLDIGNQTVANAQLDLAGSKVWAVVFTIRMQ